MSMRGGMGGGGGRGGLTGRLDPDAVRAENEAAPRVANLRGRVLALFAPYRAALALIMLLVVAGAALSVVPPLLTQQAFDVGLFPADGPPNMVRLLEIIGLMLLVYAASGLIGVWQTYQTTRVGNTVMGRLRERMFTHLQAMELSFFTRTKTGVIQSRLQNDVGGVASVLTNTFSNILGNVVQVIAALVAMLLLSWQLTIVAVVLMPFLVLAQRRVGVVRAKIAGETQESLSRMTAITQEALSVSGILLAKSFNRQRAESDRYSVEVDAQIRLQVRQAMSGQWFFALVNIVLSAIPAVVYLVAGWLITGEFAEVTAGTIVAFTTVQSRLLFPLVGLMRIALDVQTSAALFARIFEYLDLTPRIEDRPDAVPLAAHDPVGRIRFEDVTFRYPDQADDSQPTLDRISFDIAPGTFAAFVGPSGAGKTTILYLVPRLYEATGGSVLFASHDVRELTQESLIDHVGIVSQETYLFHASIADNLRYAKPDATQSELEAACRAANIHDTIAGFADGYDTLVGERGYRLSGGEKQRIAIARVLLKDPPVLILDEATSALDTVSERVVQAALDDATKGRTTLAIAHRLSTVVDADVIYVVVAGRVVEQGTHRELLALGGEYARLYTEQATPAPS